VNAQPIRRLAEFLAVRTVAVAQQVTRAVVPREGFQELAGRPFRYRVREPALDLAPSIVNTTNVTTDTFGRTQFHKGTTISLLA